MDEWLRFMKAKNVRRVLTLLELHSGYWSTPLLLTALLYGLPRTVGRYTHACPEKVFIR